MRDRLTRPYNYIHSNEAANARRAFAPFGAAVRALTAGKLPIEKRLQNAGSHLAHGGSRLFEYFSGASGGSKPKIHDQLYGIGALRPGGNRGISRITNTGKTRLMVGAGRSLAAYAALRVAGMAIGGISDALSGD